MKTCKLCKKQLASWNKSNYCTSCYVKSPQMLEYQRNKQKEWYYTRNGKIKKRKYRKENAKKIKKYQQQYQIENIDRIRELKREWAKQNRAKNVSS